MKLRRVLATLALAWGALVATVAVHDHNIGLPEDSWWVAACGPIPGVDRCAGVYPNLVAHLSTPVATGEIMTWGVQVNVGPKCLSWDVYTGLELISCTD